MHESHADRYEGNWVAWRGMMYNICDGIGGVMCNILYDILYDALLTLGCGVAPWLLLRAVHDSRSGDKCDGNCVA